MRQAAVVGGWVEVRAACCTVWASASAARTRGVCTTQTCAHRRNLTSNWAQPSPRLVLEVMGGRQPTVSCFLWWLRLCEGLWMATNAAQAQASSASGQGRGSSAADDPPDPSAAWYMTKAQLEKTPARKALLQKFGQDAEKAKEKEAQYRRLTVGFLQEAGQKLRLCVPRPVRGLSAPFPGSSHGGGAEALTPGRARSA